MKVKYTIEDCLLGRGEDAKLTRCAVVNGEPFKIYKDVNGNEYFKIENPYVDPISSEKEGSLKNIFALHFKNRISDAIKAIQEGYAHCLVTNNILIPMLEFNPVPVILLDDEKGEELRTKCIEFFKNASFGYKLLFGNNNSMRGYFAITSDDGIAGGIAHGEPAYFETYEDAQKKMDYYLDTAEDYARKVAEGTMTFDEVSDIVGNGKAFIIEEIFYNFLKEEDSILLKTREEFFKDWGYEIAQHIVL